MHATPKRPLTVMMAAVHFSAIAWNAPLFLHKGRNGFSGRGDAEKEPPFPWGEGSRGSVEENGQAGQAASFFWSCSSQESAFATIVSISS